MNSLIKLREIAVGFEGSSAKLAINGQTLYLILSQKVFQLSSDVCFRDLKSQQNTFECIATETDILLDGSVIAFDYVPELDSLCIGTEMGDLLVMPCDQASPMESVGSIDSGIMTMSWSPDYELLVLVTGIFFNLFKKKEIAPSWNSQRIFKSCASRPWIQTRLDKVSVRSTAIYKSIEAQVNVGWGKKETQFQYA